MAMFVPTWILFAMMLESCSWLAQIQQKKELSKSDGLGPRYKQSCGVGVHVDISTQWQ